MDSPVGWSIPLRAEEDVCMYMYLCKLNSGATEMKLQTEVPIWGDGACSHWLHPGRYFLQAVRGFCQGSSNC